MRSALLLLLSACGTKDDAGGLDTGLCVDAPVLMWSNFGEGFLIENCQTCHASTTTDRHDAPEDVVFDTLADVQAERDAILDAATGDDPSMPPQGGVSDDDRLRLEIWLTCWIDEEEG